MDSGVLGPLRGRDVKVLAESGQITRQTEVRVGDGADWSPASRIRGIEWPADDAGEHQEAQRALSPKVLIVLGAVGSVVVGAAFWAIWPDQVDRNSPAPESVIVDPLPAAGQAIVPAEVVQRRLPTRREAIDAYLRATLHHPDYEIVEWGWSAEFAETAPFEAGQMLEEEREKVREAIAKERAAGKLISAEEEEARTGVEAFPFIFGVSKAGGEVSSGFETLTFRARNSFGGQVIVKWIFLVKDGEVMLQLPHADVSELGTYFMAAIVAVDMRRQGLIE